MVSVKLSYKRMDYSKSNATPQSFQRSERHEVSLISIPISALCEKTPSRLEKLRQIPTPVSLRNQNGNPTERCKVPRGSPARRFMLRPYSSLTGPTKV